MKRLLIAVGVLVLGAGLAAGQQQNGNSTSNPQSPDTEQNQRMTGTQGSTTSAPAGQTDSTDRAVGASGTVEHPVTNPATLGTSSPSQKDANRANNSDRTSDGAPVGSSANTARPDVKGSSGKVTPVDQGVERAPNPDKVGEQQKKSGSEPTDTHNPEASNPTQPK
jgi:hypothetical protein